MKPAFMGWPALLGVPKDLARDAIGEADQIFEHVLGFAGERIDKRRELACWWAIVHLGIIRRTNAMRDAQGLRPRPFRIRRRWAIRAEAMCEANRQIDPRLAVICKAVHQRMAEVGLEVPRAA